MLWLIVILVAVTAYMYHKRQMTIMSNVADNTGGGIVTPGRPAN